MGIPLKEHGSRPAVYERVREGLCPYGERLEPMGERWTASPFGWCDPCGCGWRFVTLIEDGVTYERAEIVMTSREESERLTRLVHERASVPDESKDA